MHSDSTVLTPTQIEQFEREGFLLVKGMLDDATRQTIIASLSDMAARRDDYPPHAFVLEPDASQAQTPLDEVRKFQSLQVLNHDLRRLFEGDSRPRRAASQLMKADDLRIQFLSCFAKPARIGGETPWHQDQGLWPLWMPTATSCWIALDAATLENGCVRFARGSHRRGMAPHLNIEGKIHESIPQEMAGEYEIVPVEMEPGDGVFFGGQVWHYSEPNRSARRRLEMPVVYVSERELQRAFTCSQWIAGRQEIGKPVVVGPELRRQYETATLID
jgi:ectoine hydroxylase-related dioxygenase (phytanoyl-CoA dioxygenase family)